MIFGTALVLEWVDCKNHKAKRMEFIELYEFDTLSFIDREYDQPEMRNYVNSLVQAEMKTFKPADYLQHMPYPEIKSRNPIGSFDGRRYQADKPEPALEKDAQAWRNAVSNIKAQIVHQENKLMNLELMEGNTASIWLQHNSALEMIAKNYNANTENTEKDVREINKSRQASQEKAYPELVRLKQRRDHANQVRFHCQSAVLGVARTIESGGHRAYDDYVKEQQAIASRDLLTAEFNSTIKAYETVNESYGDEKKPAAKKQRT